MASRAGCATLGRRADDWSNGSPSMLPEYNLNKIMFVHYYVKAEEGKEKEAKRLGPMHIPQEYLRDVSEDMVDFRILEERAPRIEGDSFLSFYRKEIQFAWILCSGDDQDIGEYWEDIREDFTKIWNSTREGKCVFLTRPGRRSANEPLFATRRTGRNVVRASQEEMETVFPQMKKTPKSNVGQAKKKEGGLSEGAAAAE